MITTIIGSSATGKSSAGSIVAKNLNATLFDTDLAVSQKVGLPIYEIFSARGIEYVQELTLLELQDMVTGYGQTDVLVILGASALPDSRIRSVIKESSQYIICLESSVDIQIKRLTSGGHAAHPLVSFYPEINVAKMFLMYRKYFNHIADDIIVTDNLALDEVADSMEKMILKRRDSYG